MSFGIIMKNDIFLEQKVIVFKKEKVMKSFHGKGTWDDTE